MNLLQIKHSFNCLLFRYSEVHLMPLILQSWLLGPKAVVDQDIMAIAAPLKFQVIPLVIQPRLRLVMDETWPRLPPPKFEKIPPVMQP